MDLQEKLELIPSKPGVYLMKDSRGKILYIGRSVSLSHRVRSYFSPHNTGKVKRLVSRIADIEFIVTDSEVEAIILEANLIKENQPRYNVLLKDDKSYPYIKLTVKDLFPQAFLTRSPKEDGSKYYGPYTNVRAARETLRLLHKLFPLRHCQKKLNGTERMKPCLNYYIKRCLGPCTGEISPDEYQEMVKEVGLFLDGKREKLIKKLRKRMMKAAEDYEFERAAVLRDRIRDIERISQEQKLASFSKDDQDIIAKAEEGNEACVMNFFIREGRMIGKEHFFLTGVEEEAEGEILTSFLKQYYLHSSYIPSEIIIEHEIEDKEAIEKWLSTKRGKKVKISVPKRGKKLKLVEMVKRNAQITFDSSQQKKRVLEEAIALLKDQLGIDREPHLIEAFDISNIQGRQAVGSMVVFEEGVPKKSAYRRFKIRTVEGVDDYAMMREVIERRYRRLLKGEEEPDLILIDGGKGQLSAAREILTKLELAYLPTIGLAKKEEHIFISAKEEPIILPRSSQALHLLQRVRDEAHRFALSYHRKLRTKSERGSIFENIPGIGEKRRRMLLDHFGSLEKIREATVEELKKVPGISEKLAGNIRQELDKLRK